MQTVVLGWFGGSAVWFIPFFWRLAKSAWPGGTGLRGPGTIRLWLGVVCVLAASCTLEATFASAATDALGRVLPPGPRSVLGPVGTPPPMLAVGLAGAPRRRVFQCGESRGGSQRCCGREACGGGRADQAASRGRCRCRAAGGRRGKAARERSCRAGRLHRRHRAAAGAECASATASA